MLKSSLVLTAALLFSLVPAQAEEAKGENPAMRTIGALGAQGVFSTYMAIAELADLYGGKTYDKEKALQLAGAYSGLTEAAKESLSDLVDSGKLNADDETAVTQMIAINDLLGKTAQGIIAFIKEPTDENQASYEKNRQKSWKSISKFLGLEE
jgi:hypothetical protein